MRTNEKCVDVQMGKAGEMGRKMQKWKIAISICSMRKVEQCEAWQLSQLRQAAQHQHVALRHASAPGKQKRVKNKKTKIHSKKKPSEVRCMTWRRRQRHLKWQKAFELCIVMQVGVKERDTPLISVCVCVCLMFVWGMQKGWAKDSWSGKHIFI